MYATRCNLFHLAEDKVYGAIETAIPALASINLRIEEMQMHSSLTEFDEDDIDFFESRLRSPGAGSRKCGQLHQIQSGYKSTIRLLPKP